MASGFDDFKKAAKPQAAVWKKARKAEGFRNLQSPPGHYKGKLKIDAGKVPKGTNAGAPFIKFVCTVEEPDENRGQNNTKDYVFGGTAAKIQETWERLAADMKAMFPGATKEIANSDLDGLVGMLADLADDLHDVDFAINEYIAKNGPKKGQKGTALNIGIVTVADSEGGDEEEAEDEEAEEEDSEEEESEEDEEAEEEADEEEEEDEEEESEEFVPTKGELVKIGKSTYKVSSVNTKAKTVKVKNVNTGNVVTKKWDACEPADEE